MVRLAVQLDYGSFILRANLTKHDNRGTGFKFVGLGPYRPRPRSRWSFTIDISSDSVRVYPSNGIIYIIAWKTMSDVIASLKHSERWEPNVMVCIFRRYEWMSR